MIIVLEGIDGCGKGTQASILGKELAKLSSNVGLMKFPDYSTPMGQVILGMLQGKVTVGVAEGFEVPQSIAQAMVLQGCAQANKVERAPMVEEYRDQGYLVLDRWWQSAVPYGSAADGLDEEYMTTWGNLVPQAHVHILFDLPAETAIERQISRGLPPERYEGNFEKLHIVRQSYLKMWKHGYHSDPRRWYIIDATLDRDSIAKKVLRAVKHAEAA